MSESKVIVVDFMWLYFKSAATFAKFSWKGVKTGPLYGAVRDITSLYKKHECPIIIATEPKSNAARKKAFEEYKGDREYDPDMFTVLEDTLEALVTLPYVAIITAKDDSEGEADDVICSYIEWAYDAGVHDKFLVYSTDKDLLQIGARRDGLAQKLHYVTIKEGQSMNFAEVSKATFDVDVSCLLQYRAIVGDASDNIPKINEAIKPSVAKYVAGCTKEETWSKVDTIEDDEVKSLFVASMEEFARNHFLMELKTLPLKRLSGDKYKGKDVEYFVDAYGVKSFRKLLGTSV